MIKNILVFILSMGLTTAAFAELEIQITPNTRNALSPSGGTAGGLYIIDNGNDSESVWGLSAEAYTSFTDQIQLGGVVALADPGGNSDTQLTLGALGRFNLMPENLRDSMFVNAGVIYSDYGPVDSIALNAGFGKRYALSDTITWTPNVQLYLPVAGDIDEGHGILFNLLSFSGFMEI